MADAMTPRDALAALTNLPHYEERLTARTGGLTTMVWGLAGPAIFLTYALASDVIDSMAAYWLYGFLWMPWVLAGGVLTGFIWNSHAISLRREPDTGRGLAYSLGLTGFFLLLAGALYVGFVVVGAVSFSTHHLMVVANGLFAVGLGAHQMRGRHPGGRLLLAAGCIVVVAGFMLRSLSVADDASALLGAAITGLAWFGAGILTYRQG